MPFPLFRSFRPPYPSRPLCHAPPTFNSYPLLYLCTHSLLGSLTCLSVTVSGMARRHQQTYFLSPAVAGVVRSKPSVMLRSRCPRHLCYFYSRELHIQTRKKRDQKRAFVRDGGGGGACLENES